MLVDVIELYFQGEKLSREARRQVKPVRGRLTVDHRWTHSNLENPPRYADVRPGQLETLCYVQLRYWNGRNVVLSGKQKGPMPDAKRVETYFEQWWWCRIVTAAGQPEPRRS